VVLLNIKNTDKAFFADKAVRQALLMAINRQSIIDRLLFGQALVAVGPILPGTWASYEQLEPTAFDPAEAGALLDADGWALPAGASVGSPEYVRAKDKQPLQFELVHADNPLHTQMAGLLQSYWAAVGVQVSLKAVTAASVLQDYLAPRQYEAVLTDIDFTRFPDPDPYPFWHDSQVETGQNYGGYEDRNTSIWLEQARTISDLTQRAELYRSFQHRFIDQVPALLLYNPVYTTAIDSQVRGVTIGPLADPSDRFASITHWYLLVRRGARPGSTPTAGG
jgi:peptide/nickel transport system substrate-binding protein